MTGPTGIDSHQHFWRYDPAEHVWMTGEMGALKRDYLPENLHPLLAGAGMAGSVVVQARQVGAETAWLLDLADRHEFIRGVVGWVDLRSPAVAEELARYAAHPRLVGVRHVVHDEPDDRFMLDPAFRRGLSHLAAYGLTYDLLLFPRHMPVALEVVREFPDQPFVLDHIGKPDIKGGVFTPWDRDLAALAACPNVWCKLSGMVTEASWASWRPADLAPALEMVVDRFGAGRLMIGSDWPVCTLAGGYGEVMQVVRDHLASFSAAEREAVLGGNAREFYRLT